MKNKLEGTARTNYQEIEQWAALHNYHFEPAYVGYGFHHDDCEPLAEADYQNGMKQDPRHGHGNTLESALIALEDNIEEYENDYK